MVTLQDVARQAGVSPMTVPNVVNGKASVRPAARQRVLDAIETTGNRVNPLARALAGGRNRLIRADFTKRP
ncbi:LacI family DNA-binding transcriptional regulator [Deinococcus sp.]|uniref:LacI family DNA-binding transcriptional regulator n=1 Tax=Deinococcus sp. TaxID=47478 RepID=UPI0025F43272|nr:LacI family DNA-binding transcriptional regulator [Deinococcus sp.]